MELKEKNRLLRIRKVKNSQRPSFQRVESWRYKKLSKSGWRKQRGIDNKTRRQTKNGVVSPEPGFQGPKKTRGLHPSGLEDVLITHVEELESLDPKFQAIRIVSRLGAKKRLVLAETAKDKGFRVLNINLSTEDLFEKEEIEEEEEVIEETESKKEGEVISKKEQIRRLKEKQSSEESKDETEEEESEEEEL